MTAPGGPVKRDMTSSVNKVSMNATNQSIGATNPANNHRSIES
eukprot:CAMPEP_0182563742 /NCGR_PEP_ID=MMETSP1324-20130603/5822_1 /TAXON_ID=236786 /ORGANISM="Florenciella sp., Strain RCC1587" /LENGTH=42 /DNA_ID= /DNA_START= /DNA_END= /DNA_ORIENTATION=